MSINSKAKNNAKKNYKKKRANQQKAMDLQEKQKIPTIYFDESGNTGSNLLDRNQPVFTLASCIFSEKEAEQLLELIGSNSQNEVHFKTLRRRKSGQDAIIRLMSNKLITPKKLKVNIFHKEFMITSKIVDILVEHMMHAEGEDLYLNGRNIALSNMLYCCLPTFCDESLVQEMYKSFVVMIREQDEADIDRFYSYVEDVKASSSSEEFKKTVDIIINTKNYIQDALESLDKTALDPSIPAFFSHCVLWGQAYPKGFHVIHDDSHSIEKERGLLALYMDWTQSDIELGYDRRKIQLPLKGRSLNFASSEKYLQLQVSDIIASSFSYWAAGVGRGESQDYLYMELAKLNLDRFVGNSKIWPTTDVTPESLGTVHDGGLNAANHIPFFLSNAVPNPDIANT